MAQTNVSNGVLTIIASFTNGLDILKRLRRVKKKHTTRSKKSKQQDEDASRLSRSLRHGPEEIGREYQTRSMRCDVERYAVGDATAQTSLAEILLKLNTGLVSIIASFLNHDKGDGKLSLDYQSLTDLSEQSRVQTIGVLRQLSQRLKSKHIPPVVPRAHSNGRKPESKSQRTAVKHAKKRRPVLAQVLIENSSTPSQIAMVRPAETRRRRSIPRSRSLSESLDQESTPSVPASMNNQATPPPPYLPTPPMLRNAVSFSNGKPKTNDLGTRTTHRSDHNVQPSSGQISPPHRTASQTVNLTSPLLHSGSHNSHNAKARRLRPDTLYSIGSARTGSTKLGEIPMHKWAEPWNHEAARVANEEALANGWPVDGDGDMTKLKRGGWKRWFRK